MQLRRLPEGLRHRGPGARPSRRDRPRRRHLASGIGAAIAAARTTPAHGVSLGEATRVWLRVAALSFGGPAGQIAVMHRIVVDEKKWISESRFLYLLSY